MDNADPFGWVGRTIDGKFEVESIVGEGGFGVVYRGRHLGFGDAIAIKCLKIPPGVRGAARDEFRSAFLEEGRLLRKLSCATTGIVQALDAGDAMSPSGVWTPYLVLEWLQGESIETWCHRTGRVPMDVAAAVQLLDSAARALAVAHNQGIAHRDIKPANIFIATIAGQRMTKVLDFGIAKVMTETTSLTRALQATGQSISAFTPAYGAPEQFHRRFGATGTWTDVFALALVMVELITGRPALEGDDATQLYVAATDPSYRPTPSRRGADIMIEAERVLERALAVDPKQRFLTVGAFWDALSQALASGNLDRVSGATRMASPQTQLGAPAPGSLRAVEPAYETQLAGAPASPTTGQRLAFSPPTATVPSAPPRTTRRSPALIVIPVSIGVLALAGLGAGGWWMVRGSSGVGSAPTPTAAVPSSEKPAVARMAAPPEGMVFVPAGTFEMGAAGQGKTEVPHRVTLTRGFFLDRTEVTVAAYRECVRARACQPTGIHGADQKPGDEEKYGPLCNEPDPNRSNNPINCIDRDQAETFCKFKGKRLPTEAEWEYAARGGDSRLYPWGDSPATCDLAVVSCGKRSPRTEDVALHTSGAAPCGALDMVGNVWEWVADAWDPDAYKRGNRIDPAGSPSGEKGVLRGGSWDFDPRVAKATYRLPFPRTTGQVSTGVRCAKTAE